MGNDHATPCQCLFDMIAGDDETILHARETGLYAFVT